MNSQNAKFQSFVVLNNKPMLSEFFHPLLQVVVPPLPGKALIRQLPFRGDDGIFDDEFIEERRKGLEQFLNK